MDLLQTTYLGNTVRAWLVAAGVAAGLSVGLRLVISLVLRRLRKVSERTATQIDDIAAAILGNTKGWAILYAGIWLGARPLELPATTDNALRVLAVLVAVLQAGAWGNVAIAQTIRYRVRTAIDHDPATATTMAALGFLVRIALWSVLLLMAMSNLGIEIGPVLTGLGVGGVAVALAVQSVLGDLFASLSIVLDKPFVIGDFINVDGFAGNIEHVGLKTTRIRSLTGEQLVFSNSDLLKSRIRNYKRMQERRILFIIGVVYQTPRDVAERIPEVIRETIESKESVRFDRAHFKAFGPFSLDFEAVYWVLSPDYNTYMDIQQKINLELLRRFQEYGIEFAYPTQTVFLEGSAGKA